MGIAFEGM